MNWPGTLIPITPPQLQHSFDELFKAGTPPIRTFGLPGIQVPAGTGMQGIGVSTPNAAAVAAATIGFDTLVQTPNGRTFRKGTQSEIVAAGIGVKGRASGKTIKAEGAAPKVH